MSNKAKSNADILDALKEAQAGKGYLSEEDICKVAKEYGRYPSEVYETATFYTMLHVGKKPEHVIEVCGSTCCDAGGAAAVISAVGKELGIGLGETTKDGKWLFRRCECLGRCDTAPNVMIDGELITNASGEDVVQRIRKAGR
ncbi:MAG: NAD(P)H-dependent oxidoreductase subunit E [Lachnospiraceae bacterium]|nr:NAD(P)H-dependent oxidoreductase subunit E [Lachnospiraceae bacterium]